MTQETYSQLKTVANKQFNYFLKFSEARSLWRLSIYYNKLQNQFLKDNEPEETVKIFYLYDEETKQAKRFLVKAKKKYSRLQWFVLLLGSDLCIYSRQQIKALPIFQ